MVAAAGGLLLFLSLFLTWYGVSNVREDICGPGADCSGFETFGILDILLVMAAFAPWILVWIVVRGHELSWPPGEVTMIVGISSMGLILCNGIILGRPGDSVDIGLDIGWFVALLATIGLLVAGYLRQAVYGDVRKPPGVI